MNIFKIYPSIDDFRKRKESIKRYNCTALVWDSLNKVMTII